MEKMNLNNRSYFTKEYLQQAVNEGFIVPIYPNHPRNLLPNLPPKTTSFLAIPAPANWSKNCNTPFYLLHYSTAEKSSERQPHYNFASRKIKLFNDGKFD